MQAHPKPCGRHPLARVLEALIVVLVIAWILDLPRALGFNLYTEQLLLAVLGLVLALAFIVLPAKRRAARSRVPPWDYAAAAAALGVCGYLAARYDYLVTEVSMRPADFVWISSAVLLLVVEATRRATGMTLIWYLAAGVVYALWGSHLPGAFAAQAITVTRLVTYLGLDTNALLGAPLHVVVTVVIPFIVLGQVIARAGGSEFFTDLAMALMGRYRGGTAKVSVTGSALFGMISGSAVANVSAVGVVTIPLMTRAGFPPMYAAAIEAVGSTGGQLVPPVMGAAAFLIAEYLQISYADVVVAAVIPALMYYASLFMQVDLAAAAHGIAGAPRERLPALRAVLRDGWHFLLPFAVIVVGLLGYGMEPEYTALLGTAVLIGACLLFPYRGRRLGIGRLLGAVAQAGSSVLDIVLICAAAGVLIGILNISGLAFGLTLHLVDLAGANLPLLLLITAAIGILLGLGLPTVGVYVLMATLVAPALVKLGVPALAAHLFVMYFGMMSMVTPPVALAAYAAANIAQSNPSQTGWMAARVGWASYLVPFLFVYDPPLLMDGGAVAIAWAVLTNLLGLWCGTIGVVGFYMTRVVAWQRAVFLATGLALLFPAATAGAGLALNVAGLAAATVLLLRGYRLRPQAST
jgi:TRAP transporter 4TM/12TM fusion protein